MINDTAREKSGNGGFTLIEVFIAVLIVGFVLIGIGLAFSSGYRFIAEIRDVSAATQAAQEVMELVRDTAFDDIRALDSSFTTSGFGNLINPTGTLTVDDPYSTDNIKRVTVTVSWISR